MNDSNRKFNNELAAFKSGETVNHSEAESIISVSKKGISSALKLSLILIVLSISGYYLIKKPIAKHQLNTSLKNASVNTMSLKEYRRALKQINPNLLSSDSLIIKLYESNISPNSIQKMVSADLVTSTSIEFYKKVNDVILKDTINDLSGISGFISRNSESDFFKAIEVNADVNYIVELQNAAFFSNTNINDIINLSLADKNRILLQFNDSIKLHALSTNDWIEIAETFNGTEYLELILSNDKKNELDISQIIALYSAQIPLSEVVDAIQKGEIESNYTKWVSKS